MSAHLEVLRPGSLTTVQDEGRPGHAHLGVARGGALDPAAMRLANRLVGNRAAAPVLETTLDGVSFFLNDDRHVAVTGAAAPLSIDGRPAAWGPALRLARGEVLDVGRARLGVRCYVAVAGGILAEPALGSCATDLLAGIGPPPLRHRDLLGLGPVLRTPPAVDLVPHSEPPAELHLACWLGPRDDELVPEALAVLGSAAWTVTPASNRIALRLSGPRLERVSVGELASEGLVLGSIQVPPDGQPVLFLADHPTTGGYPVVAVVPEPELWRCAQAAPGSTICLHPAPLRRGWARALTS